VTTGAPDADPRPVIPLEPLGRDRPRPPVSRSLDRRITASAVALAGGFVLAAALSALAPAAVRLGWWMPLHLLLAGAAATAIAGVMPFFSAAVAAAPPAPAGLRVAGVAGVAAGALAVTFARILGDLGPLVGGVGGLVYLGGLVAVGASTLLPLRFAIGPRRVIMGISYGTAVGAVFLGAVIGTLFLVRWQPVLAAWDVLRPAHAWLNAYGFVSLVIGASLIHLLPTVAGTRIERSRATVLTMVGLGVGPAVTALGFMLRADALAFLGAALTLAGALALGRHAIDVVARRGRWTTDHGWHAFALASLVAAICWFILAAALGAAPVLANGATARGWDGSLVVAPLALGWVLQALVGSWTHLVPAVGPGDAPLHARQRRILGRAWLPRLVLFQVGVALVAVGLPLSLAVVTVTGLALLGGTIVAALVLLAAALVTAVRAATVPA
jgi:nitrite reductase (NO-forming)